MSETIEAVTPSGVPVAELSIAFSTEELVVLGRVLAEQLWFLGSAPLARIAPSAREEVLAAAARSLRARNVLTGPPDLPAVDRAVAGLVQIAARPALRAELLVAGGERLHRRYLSIPYASVQHEVQADGLHRLLPFATPDLLARMMRDAGFVERPVPGLSGFDLPYATLAAVRAAVAAGDGAAARTLLAEVDVDGARVPDDAAAAFVAALATANPECAVRLVHHTGTGRTEGGEVAWLDGGEAGLWRVPTIDQPFARLGGHDDVGPDDGPDDGLGQARVRVEPVAATDLASFLFDLLPGSRAAGAATEVAPPG